MAFDEYPESRARSLRIIFTGIMGPAVLVCLMAWVVVMADSMRRVRQEHERLVGFKASLLARQVEQLLATARQDLLRLSREKADPEYIESYLAKIRQTGGIQYCETAFISQNGVGSRMSIWRDSPKSVFLQGDALKRELDLLPDWQPLMSLPPDALVLWDSPFTKKPDAGDGPTAGEVRRQNDGVVRLAARLATGGSSAAGVMLLGFDLKQLRNGLSRAALEYPDEASGQGTTGADNSYLVGSDGWVLFQSDASGNPDAALSTEQARGSASGVQGRSGLAAAFLPDRSCRGHWEMMAQLVANRGGLASAACGGGQDPGRVTGFAPVRFPAPSEGPEEVIAGVVVNARRPGMASLIGNAPIGALGAITLMTLALSWFCSLWLNRRMESLDFQHAPGLKRLQPVADAKTSHAAYNAAALVGHMPGAIATRLPHGHVAAAADSPGNSSAAQGAPGADWQGIYPGSIGIPEITHQLERLRREIQAIAEQDTQVLIIGVTDMGRRRTAEAIHRQSHRAEEIFCHVNCATHEEAELHERLFGPRAEGDGCANDCGAFHKARKGTLFLDDIHLMPPLVQQRLLRTMVNGCQTCLAAGGSRTQCRPRLIAATCDDLSQQVRMGRFMEELYAIFCGITLEVPLLREETIEVKTAASMARRSATHPDDRGSVTPIIDSRPGSVRHVSTSRLFERVAGPAGAADAGDATAAHGHVKGLRHRTSADTRRGGQPPKRLAAQIPAQLEEAGVAVRQPPLNHRQRHALPEIIRQGGISRSQYQALVGDDLPSRTAIYDLQDLVRKQLLRKAGRGPATRYVPSAQKG